MNIEMFFETPKGKLYIYDVIDNHVVYLDALLDLYREFFPQYLLVLPDIRERAFLPATVDPRFIRHQWVVMCDETPIAMLSFRYAIRQRLGLLLSVAIRPDYRSLAWGDYRRLSEFLFRQMVGQLEVDAANSDRSVLSGVVVEIEMETSKKPYLHLIARYEEYGFFKLPITSYEPAFVRGNMSDESSTLSDHAHPMQLYMLPTGNDFQVYLSRISLLENVIEALLLDHYGLTENHWIVKQARKSVENLGEYNNERRS